MTRTIPKDGHFSRLHKYCQLGKLKMLEPRRKYWKPQLRKSWAGNFRYFFPEDVDVYSYFNQCESDF